MAILNQPKPNPTTQAIPLLLSEAKLLLEHEYLPLETGYAVNGDGTHHVAASTYMPDCTAAMIDWWFGWIHNTEQYKLRHPKDHVFSDWEGPRDNNSAYIGGHHLVHEYIGGNALAKLKISFRDPSEYFGPSWKEDFKRAGYQTAVCARGADWNPETGAVLYNAHLIHLVRNEFAGCRMRSRFWLGDVDSVTDPKQRAAMVPPPAAVGLTKHASEEMAILASKLPALYERYARKGTSDI